MDIREGFIGMIGNTPLVRLSAASDKTGCEILAKAEFLNPGGSIKDRAAIAIVLDAERRGLLRPGGLIVEGTAGNTGIGLALVANARGYRTIIVMPNNQTQEKIDALRVVGADLRLVPPAPYREEGNYVHVSRRLAEELASTEKNGVLWANQFDNTANRDGHYAGTGQEIWEQTGGHVDAFTCAVGTGGTIAGVGEALKEKNPRVKIVLADPMGASLYHYYKHGELKAEGSSITEGIGQSRVTRNLENAAIDDAVQIPDNEMLRVVYELLMRDGLCVGGSSGINVAAAIRVAKELGPGHTVVTVLCDSGLRYLSRLFNPSFLREKGLPSPPWMEQP